MSASSDMKGSAMKTSYIAPPTGTLEVTVVRDKEPYVTLLLDLGIPNFTVFSLKMPIVQDKIVDQQGLIAEGLAAVLDEMSAFMISMEFRDEVIVQIYATILATFQEMTSKSDTEANVPEVAKDDTVTTFVGSFPMPQALVNETYDKVVTAANVIKRPPKYRHIEFTEMKPNRVTQNDVGRLIRQYRGRTIKTQPKPMYMLVYDMSGRPAGTIPVGPNMKNNLMRMTKKQR